MAAKKITGTVTIDGVTTETTGTFKFASLYRFTGDIKNLPAGHSGYFFSYHRSEASAFKGTWASPAMKKAWVHVGHAAIEFI
jgi:hypothetical protein